jgi:undecaprenyl-diphosphatase
MEQTFIYLQVLLESLPISSSTHLALLGLSASQPIMFIAHGPTALMLCLYFWQSWKQYVPTSPQALQRLGRICWLGGIAETLTVLGFLASSKLALIPVTGGLAVTATLLSLHFFLRPGTRNELSTRDAIIIGCAQALSLTPGISRMASTYTAGRLSGLPHKTAFEFSCLLQVPLFAGACVYGLWSAWSTGTLAPLLTLPFIGGLLTATAGAYLLLWGVDIIMQRRLLWLFGLYIWGLLVFLLIRS